MTQPEKRNLNNPLSTSIFDDNKQVESSRPPTRVSRRTGLYIPPKGMGDYASPIYTNEVAKMNQEAEQSARKKARQQGGKYVENKDGSRTWMPGPYYQGEPVDFSFEQIVKGDDGKWTRVQKNIRMRKPDAMKTVQIPKKKVPLLRDDKGNVVTTVGEDGIKRAVRGIPNPASETNKVTPIRSVKRKGGEVRTNRGTSNTNTNNKSNTNTNNKSNTNKAVTLNKPKEVNIVKGGNTQPKKQTKRGTGKTYEDVWRTSSKAYKDRFGGDKEKAIQAMKDWNAKQDAKKAKNKK